MQLAGTALSAQELIADSIRLFETHATLRKHPPVILHPRIEHSQQIIWSPACLTEYRIYDITFLYLQHIEEIRIKREPFLVNGDWAVLDGVIESLNSTLTLLGLTNIDPRAMSGLVTAIRGMGLWANWMDMWFDESTIEEGWRVDQIVDGVKERLKRELDEMRLTYWLEF
jgi:hypothetical protein